MTTPHPDPSQPHAQTVPPIRLHSVRLGPPDAPAILFIHGITESHRYFTTRLSSLAGPYHLVLPDLPGFGYSPKPVIHYSVDTFVDAIRSFVVTEGLAGRPLHLVAHSLGSIIALEYLCRFPQDIRKLVILSLPRFSDPQMAHEIFWSGSPSYRRLLQQNSMRASLSQLRRTGFTPAFLNAKGLPWEVLSDCRRFTFQSLTSTLENCLIHYSINPVLERIPYIPTLALHGERDQVAPFEHVRNLSREYPQIDLRSFRSAGHHVLHTHPKRCLESIRDHLAGSGPGV